MNIINPFQMRQGLFNRLRRRFSINHLNQTRLDCAISNYETHLQGKLNEFAGKQPETSHLQVCQNYVAQMSAAYNERNWDACWRLLKLALRQEIKTYTLPECHARAEVLGREKEKLKEWRKLSVEDLLKPVKDCLAVNLPDARVRVEEAQKVVDDFFNDEHMRIRVLRRRINPIVVIFAVLITVLLIESYNGSPGFPTFQLLGLTVIFGLLGACASVASDLVTRYETSNLLKQFSEVTDSLRRISFGPVAAILVLLAIDAGFIPVLAKDNNLALKCCFAFVAGFSERLVMKLVEKVGAAPK